MKLKSQIKNRALKMRDRLFIARQRFVEKKKFDDPKRKQIYSKVILSKEQKRQIDELYSSNYGSKIPHTWHRHYTAFSGNFDANYFPELLYIPEFEYFENLWPEYCVVFEDKNVLPIIAEKFGIKTPDVYLQCIKGIYKDRSYNTVCPDDAAKLLVGEKDCFAKPSVDSSSGEFCFLKSIECETDANELFAVLGGDFVVQKCIKCHDSIRKIYPDSVNTFRIISYRWKDEIITMPAIMRIGRGGNYVDNAHAGGMFIAVDDDGSLHKTAYTEFKEEYTSHPDTGVVFEGYNIPLFPKVIESAKRMHEAIPQVGIVNWDFTIDENGIPVLIEANARMGGIWIVEMAHGCGPFGEKTPEVLQWMRLMKKLPTAERKKYAFGKMPLPNAQL